MHNPGMRAHLDASGEMGRHNAVRSCVIEQRRIKKGITVKKGFNASLCTLILALLPHLCTSVSLF